MRITFYCKTNRDYCAINVAKFILPNGTTLTVDRTRTEWNIVENKGKGIGDLTMTWCHCYLWQINGNTIFSDEAYITDSSGFEDLIADARVIFELEDDVEDEDYEVDVLDWSVGE